MRFYSMIFSFILLTCMTGVFAQSAGPAPGNIEDLFVDFVRDYVALQPETGTELGLSGQFDIPVNNGQLNHLSDENLDKILTMYKRYRAWLDTYDAEQLTRSQRVARKVLQWFLDDAIKADRYRLHKYVINPIFGFHNQLTTLLTGYHRLETWQDVQDYISRLEQYDERIDQLIGLLKKRQEKGIMPPVYVIDKFLGTIDEFRDIPYEENVLYTTFDRKISALENLSEEQQQEARAEVLQALETIVYPAYELMSKHVGELREDADTRAGVWKLPDGNEYYHYCLKHHTTTTMTADQIHELGLKEVERIQNEIMIQFKKLGITGSDFQKMMDQYKAIAGDRKFYYPATQEGEEQTIKDYQGIIDDMVTHLPEMFSLIPETPVSVKPVPDFKEATMSTYYQPPKLDGSGEGIFYANLSYQHFKPGMQTLTYHEAIPGHHFQFAIAREVEDARLYQALFFFTGYAEGWALYAEKLAKEYRLYKDTHSLIGYLRSELFRAARLVLDTGIHSKKWNREQALEYMLNNLGWSWPGEINRYIIWPGQACAYKVGELKILELRKRAQEQLGDAFDIKDFHTAVLDHGSVPLEVLEELVEDYIRTTQAINN